MNWWVAERERSELIFEEIMLEMFCKWQQKGRNQLAQRQRNQLRSLQQKATFKCWQREAALGAGTALHNPELPLTTLPLCPFPEMFKSQNGDKGAALPAQLLGVSSCCWGLSLAADTRNSLHQVTESTGALFWSLLCKINQLCSDKQL